MSAEIFQLFGGNNLPRERRNLPIGQILLDQEIITEDQLGQALQAQQRTKVRLGEILISQGAAKPSAIAQALAEQYGMGYADLHEHPPEAVPADLDQIDLYLTHRILPWRRVGRIPSYVTAEPADAEEALTALAPANGMAFFAVSDQASIDQAALRLFGPQLAERAALRTPSEISVRSLSNARWIAAALLFGVFAALLIDWTTAFAALCCVVLLVNIATMTTRLFALLANLSPPEKHRDTGEAVILADRRPLPKISILVPLYREASMLTSIRQAMDKVDYPRELLDVKLLLEESDSATRLAADLADLPAWMKVLIVPEGAPRTKPRAMNAALDFCDGEIIGILDAEDRPDPEQLTAVANHLRSAPPDVACVQCQLGYFNVRENWITRCFEIEYSIWFMVLMRGFQRLGLPIPLGGTSVYFRRSALRELTGWDAHNVTEDADLGMRLARRGQRCTMLYAPTEEEANCRMMPWIRQRSRWLKGYMLTWLNHMRDPVRLWKDLGPVGFAGLNVLFLGGAVTYLASPVFWAGVITLIVNGDAMFLEQIPAWAAAPVAASLILGQVLMLICAALALHRRGIWSLVWVIPTLPVYWTLGAFAAWKALIEVIAAPYYWDKTQHGISQHKDGIEKR